MSIQVPMMIDVDYPTIVLSFTYRNFRLQLDQTEWQGSRVYSVWAHHDGGCAVAVPCAVTRTEAVHRAKHWVDQRLMGGRSPAYPKPLSLPPVQATYPGSSSVLKID